MRAVRVTEWGGPEVLKVHPDVTIPEPQVNQILIKVGASGVNPVEAYKRTGRDAKSMSLPWTPGTDCAGTVHKIGLAVTNFKPGDRVYTFGSVTGTYAEYAISTEDNVYLLPDQLDFKAGAALGVPYFTAYRALIQRARAEAGQTVLVHGASGSVGIATLQFAKAYGMTVLGTAGTPEGMQLVRENGAKFVFNHRQDGYMDEIMTATSGEGVDVIIEMLADVNLQKDLEILAPDGVVAVIGSRGTAEIKPALMLGKESTIIGVTVRGGVKGQKSRKVISAAINAGIQSGWIKPHIGKEFSLEGAPQAHHEIIDGPGALGRIVLTVP
ncbi:quinone oxidoreductase-like [Amphiura filiformis]|uniref:quinone oxidoreductase-like n=1 Tax=Amphiura filiformis TaxID=82378 RepID=UPI003B22575D